MDWDVRFAEATLRMGESRGGAETVSRSWVLAASIKPVGN